MRKLSTVLIVLLSIQICYGNEYRKRGRIVNIRANYWAVSGAYYFLPLASLNAQMETMGFTKGFSSAMSIGLDYGGHFSTTRYNAGTCSLYSFHMLMPQRISSANDSIEFLMKGYAAQFDLLNLDFVETQKITVTIGLAWAFGRVKLVQETRGGSSSFYNSYFGPQLRTEFTGWIGKHLAVGVRAAYRHDWTRTGWKATGMVRSQSPAGTRWSGTSVGAYIGFGI
jgi:hypothetical protein